MELHHIALLTHDVEALASFYRDHLGLTEIARHPLSPTVVRSVWLALGDAILMIERCADSTHGPRFPSSSGFLLAFRVAVQQRVELEQRLGAAGHPVESRTAYTSYFRDPDGNRVGISHYPEIATEVGVGHGG